MTVTRYQRFMPNGIPRYVRIWDNGGRTADRYTAVFTRAHCFGMQGYVVGRRMSENPYHPQGVGMWFEYRIWEWGGRGLGRRMRYEDCPLMVQRSIAEDYCYLWSIAPAKQRPPRRTDHA